MNKRRKKKLYEPEKGKNGKDGMSVCAIAFVRNTFDLTVSQHRDAFVHPLYFRYSNSLVVQTEQCILLKTLK